MLPSVRMIFLPDSSDQDIAAAYQRYFAALATIADQLNVPRSEAEPLIQDILIVSLTHRRPVPDVDMWLRAALTSAIAFRRECP